MILVSGNCLYWKFGKTDKGISFWLILVCASKYFNNLKISVKCILNSWFCYFLSCWTFVLSAYFVVHVVHTYCTAFTNILCSVELCFVGLFLSNWSMQQFLFSWQLVCLVVNQWRIMRSLWSYIVAPKLKNHCYLLYNEMVCF